MSEVTAPILLDSTGQEIKEAILQVKSAIENQSGGTNTGTGGGEDGFSPMISVIEISGGHRITITDIDGTKTVDVMDGSPGTNGKDGNGIKSVIMNADYTLTLTFDDGTSYTTPSIRGATGATGDAGKDGNDGTDGQRGFGILKVSTSTTSASGRGPTGIAIKYKIALATVKSEAGVDEVLVGDTVLRSYYLYPVANVDEGYVYLGAYTNIRGATGATGATGADGYTPIKGVDYYTDADKSEMVEAVKESGVMMYTEQTLTEEEKAQARANIGIGDVVQNQLASVEGIGRKIMNGEITSIVLLGDSITDGAGGTGYNGNYSGSPSTNTLGYCWANAFKKFVESRYGVTVTNKGMYGTVMVTQKNAALDFITENDFVIWLTGTNDRSDPESYQNNMLSYVEAIKEKCVGMLVISNIPSTKANESAQNATMQKMDEIVCSKTAGYVPHFSMYQEFNKYCDVHNINLADCFADHVHPNDLGYFIMFTVLCHKLGLPLDAYTDYHCDALWWNPFANEEVLANNTKYQSAYTDGYGMGVAPGVYMNGYDANAVTTALSGKHITRINILVHTAGTITLGTVDLNGVGNSAPVYTKSKTVTVAQNGMNLIELDMDIGEHETLAVHYTTDTGKLMFNVGDVAEQSEMKFWTSGNFQNGADACIRLFGTIYGYESNAETLILDGTDDYTGSENDSMTLGDGIVPVILMTNYDSANTKTAVSGKHITRAVMRVNTAGAITIGTVDLNTIGQTPVYTKSKTFNITETGDNVEFPLDMDIGDHETLAFQRTSDSGQLGFVVTEGDLSFWLANGFASGSSDTPFMLYGKLYGY